MRRRGSYSIAANPVLIGAVTVLVVVVAVFLSYNANNGLPFVPSYDLRAEVPNASGLIAGNEVRMGGARIGVISGIEPLARQDGSTGAVLKLKLNGDVPPLPSDSTLRIRPRSPLGLKYVEVDAGDATDTFASGATMPMTAKTRPVEIDDFFAMFDDPTRRASSENLLEFGSGFAGRGGDINGALAGLDPLLQHLDPALRNLADPATGFDRLFPAFEQSAHEVAPVAAVQAQLFGSMSETFRAMSSVSEDLKASISGGPEALDVATRELPAQAPFVKDTTELFHRFRPAFSSLAHASVGFASAFRAGEPALRRAPALNRRVVVMLRALEVFTADPRVSPGLRRLARTASLLEPTIAFATPAQTTCNYLALFFNNIGSALSESDSVGSLLRVGILALPRGVNSEAGPASAPMDGPPSSHPLEEDRFLHSNPYPNTAAPGQTQECEAGNERYEPNRQVIGNPPGGQGTAHDETKRELVP